MHEYDAPLKCRYQECVLDMILELMEVPSVAKMRERLAAKGKNIGAQTIQDSYTALLRIGILRYAAGAGYIINPEYIRVDKTAIWERETRLTGLQRGERADM